MVVRPAGVFNGGNMTWGKAAAVRLTSRGVITQVHPGL